MKKLKYTLIALALGICSASAIFLDVHHDTQKKIDFTLDWHDILVPFQGNYFGTLTTITTDWQPYSISEQQDIVQVDIYVQSPLFHGVGAYFPKRSQLDLIYQPWPDTFLEIQNLDYLGRDVKVAKDQLSARFTFFEKDYLPAPIQVPEGGSTTLLLMGIAMCGVLIIHNWRDLEK